MEWLWCRRTVWVFQKLLIWDFHTQPSLGFTENGRKRENIQWSAVVWTKMPYWCQRSKENGQTGYNNNKNNNNNNLLHLYSAFLGSQSALHRRRGISSTTTNVQHPSGWCDGSHIVPECPTHSSLLVERRQSDGANRVWRWLGGHDGQRPMDEYGQDAGVTPYFFSKDILGFLMTTESQYLGLTSHPKDGAFYSIVSPSLHWGVRTHTDCRVSTPCWPH